MISSDPLAPPIETSRLQQKRSHGRKKPYHIGAAKVTNLFDPNAGNNHALTARALGDGNTLIRKQVGSSKVASDSSSCCSRITEEDSFAFELRLGSSKQAGVPLKKLLTEDLSEEMESRRRPPSVIARLMGLDALPPQQIIHKQRKKFSENYLQRTASIGSREKSSSHEGRSFRMSNKEQQDFKDVFEVLETSKAEKQSNVSVQKLTANSKPGDTKMALIRQKFMDAKRLSTDEKLQQSKEFHDALEVLDSNKDLLLKFLQEPDSLFTKHLHDLQGVPPPPQLGHIAVLKSSNACNYENSNTCLKSERKTERKDATNTFRKHEHGFVSQSHNKHDIHISHKVLKSRFARKDETCRLPTKIVVLKPNLGMTHTARSVLSPGSSGCRQSDYRRHRENRSSENWELHAEVRNRKISSTDEERMRRKTRGSGEIAKEATRQMRDSVSSGSIKVLSLGLRGYAGDESSGNMSGYDSANESEVMTPIYRDFYDRKSGYSSSSSYSTETSVTREAKKRLSERWKITHRFQEMEMVGRGSTLGEMLAMADREMGPVALDPVIGQDVFVPKDVVARRGRPLGISSRDGWKNECTPRSRSLPASSTVFGSPKTSIRHGALGDGRCLMLTEATNRGPIKPRKGVTNQREDAFAKTYTRSSRRKSQSFLCAGGENIHTAQKTNQGPGGPRKSVLEKDLFEQKPMTLESLADDVADIMQFTDEVGVAKPKDVEMSSEIPEEQLPEPTACTTFVKDGDSSPYDPDDSIPEETSIRSPKEGSFPSQFPVTEPESPASSMEAEQPSPVSVLEPLFVEDISPGSECFERVSADLHGLRMQLQLLKLESSDAYNEGLEMTVSSDEDNGEGSLGLPNEKGQLMGMSGVKQNRDFSYLVDVLVDSGFHDLDMDILLATFYSPGCPVGPAVFEKLEKKYGEQLTWPRSERRLLFDCINSGLVEILRPYIDLYPWVKPVKRNLGLGQPLTEELWKVLISQGKEGNEDSAEMVLGREVRWLELGDDIDAVGREIERMLMDEMVAEIVNL